MSGENPCVSEHTAECYIFSRISILELKLEYRTVIMKHPV